MLEPVLALQPSQRCVHESLTRVLRRKEKKRHDYFSRGKTLFCRVVPSEHCWDVPVNLKVMTEVICNETNVENSALKLSIM